MTVTLYNCSSGSNVLNKTYTIVGSGISATVKGSIDIDQPILLLNYTAMDFNYVHIDTFGRYYNVINRELSEGSHIKIGLQSDPLESFRTQISGLEVYAVRCEDTAYRSAELADNNIPVESDLQIDKVTGDTVIGSGTGYIVLGVV